MVATSVPEEIDHLSAAAIETDSEIESRLTEEIRSLWAAHQDSKTASKQSKDRLKAVRSELAEKLHSMKSLLVRTGRNGGWAAYLRTNRLARATADRYVSRHESLLNPPSEKRLAESISEPTEDDVRRLVRSLLPRLRRVLTTREWVDWFAEEVALQLNV
jgi:hypothetical protein